jgi:hypothetical protein
MAAIRKIAEKYKLHPIEDAARSLGGKYSGKMSGSAADIAAFSFHGTKTLTTGEGGMFVTDNEAILLGLLAESEAALFVLKVSSSMVGSLVMLAGRPWPVRNGCSSKRPCRKRARTANVPLGSG